MPETVIPDTSVLIILDNIGALDLLHQVYGEILVPGEVHDEFSDALPEWISVVEVSDKKYLASLETQVDPGEASVIALAEERNDPLLILDDRKARKLAERLDLKFTGTLGVLYKAKQKGIIDEVKPLLQKLLEKKFRISEEVLHEFLRLNRENE